MAQSDETRSRFDYSDHTQQGRHQRLTLKHGGLVNGTTLQVTEVGRWTGAALVVPVTTLMLSLSKVLHPPHIITTLPTGSWRNQGLLVGHRLVNFANANHRPQRLVSYKANPSANCRESSRGSVVSLRWASTSFMTADVRPLSISRVMEGFCFLCLKLEGTSHSSSEDLQQRLSGRMSHHLDKQAAYLPVRRDKTHHAAIREDASFEF